ncbi:MAG: kynureninase [Flavobacteriaceae bacterium]|nr:kynureninase [Flavobacteriaceae bacterium]
MNFENSIEFAKQLDEKDPLKSYKNEFLFPKHNGKPVIYFTGNSLGLQPKTAQAKVQEVLSDWATLAVDGHFYGQNPWWEMHEQLSPKLANIVGAKPQEVAVMNTLTANLHFLMVSFYKPTPNRYKIICEEKAFSSDQYVFQSQLRFHGYHPQEGIIEIKKHKGTHHWHTEDILETIEKNKDTASLLLMGGVNYYNGQVFDMQIITQKAKECDLMVGWDLAHAVGNVKLELHKWGVDFATWCSYKYLNSGPGSLAGIYVNEKYLDQSNLNRFEGWWGQDKATRFQMQKTFKPMPNAEAWQLSNLPILSLAPQLASVQMFEDVGMDALSTKSQKLTGYLQFLLEHSQGFNSHFELLTPSKRGCQLSLYFKNKGREVFDALSKQGVVTDWREPGVIRLAPVPLYNSFEEMYQFAEILKNVLRHVYIV